MERTEKGDTDRKQDKNEAIAAEENRKSTKERAVEEANPNFNYEDSESSKNSECGDSKNYSQAGESDQKINDDSENVQTVNLPGRDRLAKSFPDSKTEMDEPAKDQTSEALTAPSTDEITNVQDKNSSSRVTVSNSCVHKFTLTKTRTVDNHTLTNEELTSHDQIPDYILKTLMIGDCHARKFKLKYLTSDKNKDKTKDSDSDESEDEDEEGVNPMDGLLGIFHCSDNFLQQYLAIKLSACQLSVPFLLPDPEEPSTNVKILLLALESITKSWKGASNNNESAQEVFATEYPFPVVSFIRIGKNILSKSSLINKIMSEENGDHDFFFHKDIKGGHVKRKVVDGLVELSWYLPGGSEKQTLQNEICFTNLRGDARTFKKQLDVLLKISSVLCILLPSECPDKTTTTILKEATQSEAKVILIFNEKRETDAKEYFDDLRNKHRGKLLLITKAKKSNEDSFLQSIRENIQENIRQVKATPLVELASCASEYGIYLDDDQSHCRLGKGVDTWLEQGVTEAKDLLKLQMHIPILADLEREKYRPKRDMDEIYNDIEAEKVAQKESFDQLDGRILDFLNRIARMGENERAELNYVLYKIKHQLDKMSLQVMAELHQEYCIALLKEKNKTLQQSDLQSAEEEHLKQLEESISKCSFGLEHIVRELAQLYQLTDISTIDYAGAAAEMLLLGQPLELLDGDSSYIPLRWFNAVYTKLERKTNNAKIFVISVLGIQSSGKSTMLNTMFGLEFPVSAGRCTRGAFASLIPVSNCLKSKSNFDYVLIIDTEGLRGSADSQLREHDNELATFAIGVADVTIVNIFGENYNEIKEFLEIAVHAFLKMKLVEDKKTCKIVHQNVAAIDARKKLTVDRSRLKQNLNKMANLAAIQENCEDKFQKFDDIISFNEQDDVFYIPNFFKGSPPMAPVNPYYGRAVQKMKENIITLMSSKDRVQRSVSQFREKVTNLWKAILKENFIFSFRNTIEVRAKTFLDRKYFEESVNLMVIGMAKLEGKIQESLSNYTTRDEREKEWAESKIKIRKEAEEFGKEMEEAMIVFFATNEDKATLEQWRENVMNKIKEQKEAQVMEVRKNCSATFNYLQNRQDVEERKLTYEKNLLQKATKFMTSVYNTSDADKCKAVFEQVWQQWIADVQLSKESKINVNEEMVHVLCDTDRTLNTEMTEKLKPQKFSILVFKEMTPLINNDQLVKTKSYLDMGETPRQDVYEAKQITKRVVNEALDFAKNPSLSRVRCRPNDLTQLYHKVMTATDKQTDGLHFKFRKSLKCDILLHTFAKAYDIFDKMEERYVQERDIRGELERDLRPKLENLFLNLCSEMEKEVLAAISIVDVLKKPIESKLNSVMGPAVVREILKISKFQSKGQFEASVLIQLGEECTFEKYITYFENPIEFLKRKLMESIENYCLKQKPDSIASLLENEAKKIENKVFAALSTTNKLTKTEKGELTFWIQRFLKECSTLGITENMFRVAAINKNLKNFEVFEGKVLENVSLFFQSLIKCRMNRATVQKWNSSSYDYFLMSMFGCQSCCPFCKALCDQTVENHPGGHSTRIHRPRGLAGYRHEHTFKLSTGICTTSVAGTRKFRNFDTSYKWHQFKKYQSVNDHYKSWSIPPDPSFEGSTYWQWFMARFSKELAKHYDCNEPDIPAAWKKRTFGEVKDKLQQEYNM